MVGSSVNKGKEPKMKLRLVAVLPLCLALVQPLMTGCGSQQGGNILAPNAEKAPEPKSAKNLVQILQGESRFSILVTAVKAAGLVEVLSGSSKFTVFAPSNKAFEALPAGTLESLLKPENKEQLKAILLYHVAAGELKAADVLKKMSITTAQGKPVSVDADAVRINGSGIVKTDILASNGVAHEIDAVLLPPSTESKDGMSSDAMAKEAVVATKSLTATLADDPRFSILVTAVKAAGLAETLSGSSSFTVFAPSNKAFEALPAGTLETLLKPENKEKLKAILLYHVAAGSLKAGEVLSKSSIQTVQGNAVSINAAMAKINDAMIVKTDVIASNGVIHEIAAVLLPPSEPCKTVASAGR
jgi:transforming growth factor-beta-induced protein